MRCRPAGLGLGAGQRCGAGQFGAPISAGSLASVAVPVHVIEGSVTSVVDRAICAAVRRSVQHASHSVIAGAGHMMPLSHGADLTRVLLRQFG